MVTPPSPPAAPRPALLRAQWGRFLPGLGSTQWVPLSVLLARNVLHWPYYTSDERESERQSRETESYGSTQPIAKFLCNRRQQGLEPLEEETPGEVGSAETGSPVWGDSTDHKN